MICICARFIMSNHAKIIIHPCPNYHSSVFVSRDLFFGTRTSQYRNNAATALNTMYTNSNPTLRQRS